MLNWLVQHGIQFVDENYHENFSDHETPFSQNGIHVSQRFLCFIFHTSYSSCVIEGIFFASYIMQATEEQVKLMQDQSDIESKYGVRVKGLSLFHTVLEVGLTNDCTKWLCQLLKLRYFVMLIIRFVYLQCVKGRQPKIAEQLRKEFKLSDSQ